MNTAKRRVVRDAREDLIRILANGGAEESEVRNFLYLLQVPGQLHRLIYVCARIRRAIDVMADRVPDDPHLAILMSIRSVCESIESAREALVQQIGSHLDWMPGTDTPGLNPLYGICLTRNPTWGALAADCAESSLSPEFRAMQFHLMVLQIWVTLRKVRRSEYEDISEGLSEGVGRDMIMPAANAVRHMSIPGDHNEYDLEFISPFRTSYLLALDLQKPVRDLRTPYATAFQGVARRLLGIDQPRREKPEGSGKRGGTMPIGDYSSGATDREIATYSAEDLDLSGSDVVLITTRRVGRHGLSDQQCRELEENGLVADEFAGAEGLLISGIDGTADSSSAIKRPAAASALRNIARMHQWLPVQAQSLTHHEESLLQDHLVRDIARLSEINSPSRDNVLQYLALSTIFASLMTGRSLEDICRVRVWDEDSRPPGDLCIVRHTDRGISWVYRAPTPAYKTFPAEPADLVRRRVSHIALPDISGAAAPLLRYAEGTLGAGESRVIHANSVKAVLKRAREIISKLNKDLCLCISEVGIRNALTSRLLVAAGHTVTMHIVGRALPGEAARLHYGTYTHDEIRQVYARAVVDLCRTSKVAHFSDTQNRANSIPSLPGEHIGARLCARQESANHAINKLKEEIKQTSINSPECFARYHNLYTLYSIVVLFYATAYRAVNKISPTIPLLSRESRLLIFTDKDIGGAGYHRRVSPLTEVLEAQADQYRRHLSALSTVESRFLRAAKDDRFIFLSPDGSRTDNRMKVFSELFSEFLPLPANQHRGYLKTELHYAGCPSNVIDWFLGHWAYGQSPYDNHSTMRAEHYAEVLRRYLDPIHRQLGLTSIRSKLVRLS